MNYSELRHTMLEADKNLSKQPGYKVKFQWVICYQKYINVQNCVHNALPACIVSQFFYSDLRKKVFLFQRCCLDPRFMLFKSLWMSALMSQTCQNLWGEKSGSFILLLKMCAVVLLIIYSKHVWIICLFDQSAMSLRKKIRWWCTHTSSIRKD